MSSASSSARQVAGCICSKVLQLIPSNLSSCSSSPTALTALKLLQSHTHPDLSSGNSIPFNASFLEYTSNQIAFRHISNSKLCGGSSSQILQGSAHQVHFPARNTNTAPAARSFVLQSLLTKQYSSNSTGSQARPSNDSTRSSTLHSTEPAASASHSNETRSASPVPPSEGGAASNPWINTPNLLSMGRAVSGPVIAYLIMEDQWVIAISALAVSGATDWLDGYMARKLNQSSVVGSYLDPLADKVLIGSVAIALAAKALMPWWIAAAIVGRDVGLVGGMFIHRAHMVGWRWPGATVFFSTQDVPAASKAPGTHSPGTGGSPHSHPDSGGPRRGPDSDLDTGSVAAFFEQQSGKYDGSSGISDGISSNSNSNNSGSKPGASPTPDQSSSTSSSGGKTGASDGGVPYMKPLLISKVNTVFQLALVGAYICKAQVGWPDDQALHLMVVLTVSTTVWTCVRYAHKYATGRLFQQTL